MDGHSGLVLPGLISNPEVKRSCVPVRTVLKNGRLGSLSTFSLCVCLISCTYIKKIIYHGNIRKNSKT